jgi:hypothetical protein
MESDLDIRIFPKLMINLFKFWKEKVDARSICPPHGQGAHMWLITFRCRREPIWIFQHKINTVLKVHCYTCREPINLFRKALRGASFKSTDDLAKAINDFIAAYGPTAKPFVWRKREVRGSQLKNTIVNLRN